MKLNLKHFEIAKTISYFVDRNYYPCFTVPTRNQIDIFTRIESKGRKNLSSEELKMVEPLLNGKQMYDLQIRMIYEELAEWISSGWGWYPVIATIMINIYPDRHQCPAYVRMLGKLHKKIKKETGIVVIMGYTGFDDDFKNKILTNYLKNK